MKLTKYKLGDLIVQRREKNNNFDVPIRGVSKDGFIKPKQQEADTSIYNVFYKNDFVFNPARMELNSIALNLEFDKALCSSLYEVFYVKNKSVVLPEYLNLHIKREEFARYCDYIGLGSAREYCRFANIAGYELKLPPIEVQQEIVEADRLIKRRIILNEQMIQHLEATAQAIYRKMFVDGIDKENLPEGWRMGTIGEVADIKGGKRLPKGEELQSEKNSHPYIKVADMCTYKYVIINTNFQYVEEEVQKQIKQYIVNTNDIILSIVGTIGNINVIDSSLDRANLTENCVKLINLRGISFHYLYSFLNSNEGQSVIEQSIVGGVQGKLPIYNIEKLELLIPSEEAIREFDNMICIVDNDARLRQLENSKLTELQSLLLAKMGQ